MTSSVITLPRKESNLFPKQTASRATTAILQLLVTRRYNQKTITMASSVQTTLTCLVVILIALLNPAIAASISSSSTEPATLLETSTSFDVAAKSIFTFNDPDGGCGMVCYPPQKCVAGLCRIQFGGWRA